MIRNQPKRAKRTRNQPKQPKKIAKQPKTTQNSKIGEIWDFLMVFILQILKPNVHIWAFWGKKYLISNFNDISHEPCFEGADFKSNIGF